MRSLQLIAIAATLLWGTGLEASAQMASRNYPVRPIRIVVPIASGGNMDVTARVYADKLATFLGQPVLVDNRPGGGSVIGIQQVLNSPADGYTLLAMSNSFHITPLLAKRAFDPTRDFSGIGFMNSVPMALTVGKSRPDRTVGDLVARAKKNPGTVSFASGGIGSSTHLPAALFALDAGVELLHVPYWGNAPALMDLIAGRVDFAFTTMTTSLDQVRQGELRALAVSTKTRAAAMPDIPTLAESGLPNYDQTLYTGLVVLSGTPRDIVRRLHEALSNAIASPEVISSMQRAGGDVVATKSAGEFDVFLGEERAQYDRLITETGLKAE
jgi:tripartite-type tricarboxylate transporter receptor subunit TctC